MRQVEPVEHQSAKRPRNQESEKTTEFAEPHIAEQFISSGVDDVPEFLRQLSEKPAAAQKIKVADIPAGTRKLIGRNYVVAGIPSWAVPTEVGEVRIINSTSSDRTRSSRNWVDCILSCLHPP